MTTSHVDHIIENKKNRIGIEVSAIQNEKKKRKKKKIGDDVDVYFVPNKRTNHIY